MVSDPPVCMVYTREEKRDGSSTAQASALQGSAETGIPLVADRCLPADRLLGDL
jgi:hypothetical protein